MKSHQTQDNSKKHFFIINKIMKAIQTLNSKVQNKDLINLAKILKIDAKDFQHTIEKMNISDVKKLIIEQGIGSKEIRAINHKLELYVKDYDGKILESQIKVFELIELYYSLAKQVYKHNYCKKISEIRNNKKTIKSDEINFEFIKNIVEEYQMSNLSLENFCILKYSDADFKVKDLIGIDILTPSYLINLIQIYCKQLNIEPSEKMFRIDIDLNENYIAIEKVYLLYMTDESEKGSKLDFIYNNGQKLLTLYQKINPQKNQKNYFDSAYQIVNFYENNNPLISGLASGYSNLEAVYFTDPNFNDSKNKENLNKYLKKLK